MPAKILIKRQFKEGTIKEVSALLNEFRSGAMNQPGYISGETLVKEDDPHTLLVIGTWRKMQNWKDNPKRKAFEDMLEIYQEGTTEYEEYHLGILHDE
ncbi:MAG: antibiotic biosynthesis monooxygenase [Deltaproteobacteria bacterium]|nr:antibiotic biosynthesis monooxygenase [Deltaproteobacteria bacterium]